jgi:excisionase family DNA binding protein
MRRYAALRAPRKCTLRRTMTHPVSAVAASTKVECSCIQAANRDPLMTVPEWAQYHGLTERHVRDLIAKKRIPVVRIGRAVRLRQSWGDQLVASCTEPAATPIGGRFRGNRR